jgi:hypothetical protein
MGPFSAPAWFQARLQESGVGYPCWPIDKVIEWSNTSRGGRQFEMFAAAGHDAGCVRWGLCDMPTDEDKP